jgi:hypothetical protein
VVGVQRLGSTRIEAVEVHFFCQQRQIVVGHAFADRPVHHFLDQLPRQRSGLRAATVAIVGDDRQRLRPRPGFVLLGHEPLDLVEEDPGGFEVTDEAGIAGDVHQGQQQRRDADLFERRGDVGSGSAEGLARVTAAHRERSFRVIAERLRRKP